MCEQIHGPDTIFLAIVACTDKAIIFENGTEGIEPFAWFLANLPGPLRHVIHLGRFYILCLLHF